MNTIPMNCVGPGASESFHNDSGWNSSVFLSMEVKIEHVNICEKLKAHFYTMKAAEIYQNHRARVVYVMCVFRSLPVCLKMMVCP